jgi:hypothetical protein
MKKIIAIMLTAIIAVSIISFAASAYAKPFMNWRNDSDRQGNSHREAVQQSFIRMNGLITKWGEVNVTGAIQAQSRTLVLNSTTRQGTSATAIWSTNTSRPISQVRARENFTYTFYTANLVNTSLSSLNVNGYSFFLNGTWNVFQVTETFVITTNDAGEVTGFNRNQNAVATATKAYGELAIASGGANNFTLAITGVFPLTGQMRYQKTATKMFNPFIVNNDDGVTTVTKADVRTIISAFGSSPGWGNYDQRMDYNFNYKVDICDLVTAAANVDQ